MPDTWPPPRTPWLRPLLAIALLTTPALAQDVLLFDGSLRAGEARPDDTYAFTFRLYAAAEGGAALWTEQHPLVDVVAGDFYVDLGSIEPLTPTLFATGPLYLALAVDGEPLGDREPLGTMPRAFFAIEAGGVTGQHIDPASVRVGGREVIDAQGNWVGPGGPGGAPRPDWPPADDMVLVPAGPALIGDRENVRNPPREFNLPAFEIDRLEVTVEQYAACVRAGHCREPSIEDNAGFPYSVRNVHRYGCNWLWRGRENHPMNCLPWADADAYCRAVGKQIPTQPQWEKAARGGCEIHGGPACDILEDTANFPWGNAIDGDGCDIVNFGCVGGGRTDRRYTLPVDGLPAGASPYGALQMAGNVNEYTQGCIGDIPPGEAHPSVTGCQAEGDKGFRGGSVRRTQVFAPGIISADNLEEYRQNDVGIRCVRPVE